MGRAFAELMERLGYDRYGAHGGDRGAIITRALALDHPDRVIGAHVLQIFGYPPADPEELGALSEAELAALAVQSRWEREHSGYAKVQSMRPLTLSYALEDSPAGQLAWYLDMYAAFGADPEALDPDQILSNTMLYWLTGTAGSAVRLYWEDARSGAPYNDEVSTVPTGVAVFARDDFRTIRHFAERTNPIIHWSEFDRGGHFAAMQVPDLLVGDLRTFFRRLRSTRAQAAPSSSRSRSGPTLSEEDRA